MEFVSFDLETTGTLSHLDHIVEIGAVRWSGGSAQATYQKLVGIKIPMPEQASQINGITDKMLEGKPFIEEVLPSFAEFCGNSLMVAHNAPFDFQFLARAVEDHRSPAPRGLVMDTCQLARRSFPGLANYKLSTLCDHLSIKAKGFHRAAEDARLCGALFMSILKKNRLNTDNIKELVKLSARNPLKFPYSQWEGQMSFF